MITFLHSGNIGDILYSLYTVKYLRNLHPNKKVIFYLNAVDIRMNKNLAEYLKPLLLSQDYIDEVEIISYYLYRKSIDYDLDRFRLFHNPEFNHLAMGHCMAFNIPFEIVNEPCLRIDPIHTIPVYDVIINRTPRYQNPNFPWNIVLNTLKKRNIKIGFVGMQDEYESFVSTFNCKYVAYVPVTNALETANLIKSSKLFIGNCSSAYAIAEGMKHNTIQETDPNAATCLFDRINTCQYFDSSDNNQLEKMLSVLS